MESEQSYYPLGREYDVTRVIPPVPEHCTSIDAGPVRFVVESRVLSAHAVDACLADAGMQRTELEAELDGVGASLHVYGATDGVEYLRFDCFDHEPHYHYFRYADGINQACRIDEHAIGDPIAWTVESVRTRLSAMLTYTGAQEIAAEVAAEPGPIYAALTRVEELLAAAEAAVRRTPSADAPII